MRIVENGPLPVREIENLWIPMPDGVRLAARAWLPVDAERRPVPAIVEYIPYRKRDGTAWRDGIMWPYVASHGYAVLRIDVRGTGDSEGLLLDEYTPQEQEDGVAALAWMAAQPWCSGRTGMIGVSYGGFNSLQIAARRPPSLGAIVSICASDDRYLDDAHYMGGCLLNENSAWGSAIFAQAALPPDPEVVGPRWREMWLERMRGSPLWVPLWLEHPRRDAYWKQGSVSEDYAAIRCPVYAIGGWADPYRNSVPRLLANLRAPCKGLIGPWSHGWPLQGVPGPAIGLLQETLRWWDRWLKDVENGIMDEPRYRVWMQEPTARVRDRDHQPGRWVAEPGWPSPATAPRRLHLNDGALSPRAGPERALSHRSVQWNGRASGTWCPFGGDLDVEQDSDDERSLVFDSARLEDGFEILGAPTLDLELAVDRPVASVIARLCDVDPQGASARVTYGVLNLTHRDSHEEPAPLEPDRRYRVRLRLSDIAYAFRPGHRVRVALSTSYWPIVWPSPSAVTLTLFGGTSLLTLPERPPRPEDALLAPFGEPEGMREPAMTTHAPSRGNRVWRHDPETDVAELAGDFSGGLERFDAIDMAVGTDISVRYQITSEDPLSAVTRFAWTIRREKRGDWRVRIEARLEMRCTEKAFLLDQSLAGFEGDTRIFDRSWTREIPRDLV